MILGFLAAYVFLLSCFVTIVLQICSIGVICSIFTYWMSSVFHWFTGLNTGQLYLENVILVELVMPSECICLTCHLYRYEKQLFGRLVKLIHQKLNYCYHGSRTQTRTLVQSLLHNASYRYFTVRDMSMVPHSPNHLLTSLWHGQDSREPVLSE